MKVELDLSAEQLQELDNGLMNLIKTLSEDQKTEIVKSYLQNKMNEIIEYIIRNLQEIIEQSISKYIVDNLFASKYMLDEQIKRTIWDMKNGGQI